MCAPAPPAVAGQGGEVLPQTYFEELQYGDGQNVPWDLLGRPQPPVRNAAREGAFGAAGTAILDCGSGAGDNANWLAARGYDVLGFDLSPSAVATARERAAAADAAADIAAAGGATEFVEASATALGEAARVQARARELGGFAVALDAAMLHCLDDDAQIAYVDGLRPLLRRCLLRHRRSRPGAVGTADGAEGRCVDPYEDVTRELDAHLLRFRDEGGAQHDL